MESLRFTDEGLRMRLKRLVELFPDISIKGSKEIEINGLCSNSKFVAPGNLFIAKKGQTHDGNKFIYDAVSGGATAILTDMYDPFLGVTQLLHPNVASIESSLASHYYQEPSKELHVIGITGTSGKTTSSFLIKHILEHAKFPTGLIGTIEWIIRDHSFPATMTTPDILTNQKLLREMVQAGCKAAVMEVSSHGLDQKRVEEIQFDIGVFTNFSRDHLDYHSSMESYFEAKQRLFAGLLPDKWAIFNADIPLTFQTKGRKFTYGIEKEADLRARSLKLSDKGIQFTACFQGEESICKSSLIGGFNVYNLLCAIASGICLGISLEICVNALKTFKGVPGRLEKVKNDLDLQIFVDFSHKEEALRNVLQTLKGIKRGKLITVFGCGGNRDPGRRLGMGLAVKELSDEAIITNDNPRNEDPEEIVKEILKAFDSQDHVSVELDREKAIKKAIERATPADIVLIAGKGHEKQQIFAHQIIPFDDCEVAKNICYQKSCKNPHFHQTHGVSCD